MIPEKKKTAEEIAALREGLGVPPTKTVPLPPAKPVSPPQPVPQAADPHVMDAGNTIPLPVVHQEPAVHLDPLPVPVRMERALSKPVRSLRKHEPPLAPASANSQRTQLPQNRLNSQDTSQIRKREALAALQQPGNDPAAHIRRQTASPFICVLGYMFAIAAAITAYQSLNYMIPTGLLVLGVIIMVFIAYGKPRSRHQAALLFIVVFLTLVFSALHYAPLFRNVP
jgi:hypothetical protein